MLKNYLKIAVRGLHRNKVYALINTVGLALGIACAILIFLAIRQELSYDRFHPDADQLYRVVQDVSWGEGSIWEATGPLMGPTLTDDFAEVEQYTRLLFTTRLVSRPAADVRVQEDGFVYADPSLFSLFAFPLLQGDPATALAAPQRVVLSRTAAARYFGSEDPIGQTLRLENVDDLLVTGVMEDLPANTHLDFDLVASFSTLEQAYGADGLQNWWGPGVQTYVRLAAGTNAEAFNTARLPAFIKRHREPQYAEAIIPRFQAVKAIHLYGNPGPGNIQFVYIFSLIGGFILLIACVNYMNLATARSAGRAREVGVRKVVGADRGQLIWQFFSESIFVTVLALALGLMLAELLLPVLNRLSGRSLVMAWGDAGLWLGLLSITAVVGLLAGSYPALALSRFMPVQVLSRASGHAAGGRRLRRGLVVVQFALSIALIVGALAVHNQLGYMRSKALGFEVEQVVAIPTRGDQGVQRGFEAFKSDLSRYPGVASVSASNWLPGLGGYAQWSFSLEGLRDDLEVSAPAIIYAAPDFLETLGLAVVAGRGFAPADRQSDVNEAFLLNETALETYEIDDPLGKAIRLFGESNGTVIYEKKGQVVGVLQDFHTASLHNEIMPATVVLAERPDYYQHILLRLRPGDARQVLEQVAAAWTARFPDRLFEWGFLDARLQSAYEQDARFGQVVGAFALLAILIACLGLFGLAAFTAEQRTKEIGIRKVMGASVGHLVLLLSREFAVLIAAAMVLAAPLAYVAMEHWLDDFAYRITLTPAVFLGAGAAALAIGLLSVGYQAMRTATANPIDALRYE